MKKIKICLIRKRKLLQNDKRTSFLIEQGREKEALEYGEKKC
jgi:hypothetical protein